MVHQYQIPVQGVVASLTCPWIGPDGRYWDGTSGPYSDGPPPDPPGTVYAPVDAPRVYQMAAIITADEPDGVWRCHYCRVRLTQLDRPWRLEDGELPTRDHVVPRSRGGPNDLDNMVVSCVWCNSSKGARLLSELPVDWQSGRPRLPRMVFG